MYMKPNPELHTCSLMVCALVLLALLPGCPVGDPTFPGFNQSPTANAGADRTIDVGQRVTLNGLGSTDADDDALTYIWEQGSGPPVTLDDPNTAQPSFVPVDAGFYEFALTVTDDWGGSDISVVRVFVGDVDPETCPRVDAGTDQTVNEGAAVRLRGGNSADPGGGPLTFDWVQLSGPEVSISGMFIVEPSFAAPQANGVDIELAFELTVTNEQGCTDRDTVVITVRDRDPGDPCNDVVCGNDNLFCNGVEFCEDGDCISSGDPCSEGETCDEDTDECTEPPVCTNDADCDDDLFCNGAETCFDGSCVAGTNPCAVDETGLIAKWNLDGDALDSSGNGHNGVVYGAAPAADRLGNPNGAMLFDGTNDYIEVPDGDDWAFGSKDITIALWANFGSAGSGSIGRPGDVFIGNDEGSGTRNKWFLALGGGRLSFHINGPGTGSVFMPRAPFSPTVDQWYHLAVTRSGSTYTIYIDGDPAASAEDSRDIPNANTSLMIGRANEPWGGFMNGRLDEIAIYDRALSDAQVQALFASGDDGSPSTAQGDTCDEENDACTTSDCATDAGCDDGNTCTIDTCDNELGCIFEYNTDGCDDEDGCTENDVCADGVCAGAAKDCDDGNLCTTDTCDTELGCVFTDIACDEGEMCIDGICTSRGCTDAGDCDDGDACTTDTCVAGVCANTEVVCDADQACDALTGVCETTCADDADCDDALFCNGAETCSIAAGETAGTCTAGTSPCASNESCDEETDECTLVDTESDTIHSSEWLTGGIDPVADQDAYTFTGQAEQVVFIQVNRASGGLNPQIRLYPPSGGAREALAGDSYWNDHSVGALFEHSLSESGQYTILVLDDGLDSTGDYVLSLLNLSGSLTAQQDPDGGPIAFGDTRTGAIDPVADQDAYTFTGQAGQVVFIQVNRTSGGLNPQIRLYPPSGSPREALAGDSYWNDHSVGALFEHPLAESGQYTILVLDDGLDSTGEYVLSLTALP